MNDFQVANTTAEECSTAMLRHHEQMLKLVARSFYTELINYGVNQAEVLSVAGHLLDNVMQTTGPKRIDSECHNRFFRINDVRNEWVAAKRLSVHQVTLSPLERSQVPQVITWLKAPSVQDSFYPKFPRSESELQLHFQAPVRQYFSVYYQEKLVGVVGAENTDEEAKKLEMRKLVGDPGMHGKGIGKRATFLFLYWVFLIRKFNKVYIHSMDTNIRNLNLNGKFGFELEGIFFEETVLANRRRDVVRMALAAPVWLKLFS